MSVAYHPRALDEAGEAAGHYHAIAPELARRFLKELDEAIERIENHPETWPFVTPRSRRCILHHFPYGLIYELHEGYALIIAVSHLNRDQSYWRNRES